MKITIQQAIDSKRALETLNEMCLKNAELGIAFALAKNELKPILQAYGEESQKKARELALKDEDGNPKKRTIMTQQGEGSSFVFDDKGEQDYLAYTKTAGAVEREINVAPVLRSDLKKEKDIPGFIYADLAWMVVGELPAAAPAEAE